MITCIKFIVTYHGIETHAAGEPSKGRSALDAMLLMFQGLAFLREHIPESVTIAYNVIGDTGPVNIVHGHAQALIELSSDDDKVLNEVGKRVKKVIDGAELMTETTCDILTA